MAGDHSELNITDLQTNRKRNFLLSRYIYEVDMFYCFVKFVSIFDLRPKKEAGSWLTHSGAETISKVGGVFLDFCPFFWNFKKWGVYFEKVDFRDQDYLLKVIMLLSLADARFRDIWNLDQDDDQPKYRNFWISKCNTYHIGNKDNIISTKLAVEGL